MGAVGPARNALSAIRSMMLKHLMTHEVNAPRQKQSGSRTTTMASLNSTETMDSNEEESRVLWKADSSPTEAITHVAAAYEVACELRSISLKAAIADALLGTVCG